MSKGFSIGDVVVDEAGETLCIFAIDEDQLVLTRFGNAQTTTRTPDQVHLLSTTLEVKADPCAKEIKKLKKEIKHLNRTLNLMMDLYRRVAPEAPKPNPWGEPMVWPHPAYQPPTFPDYQIWCNTSGDAEPQPEEPNE
jgi:hypothetical protein